MGRASPGTPPRPSPHPLLPAAVRLIATAILRTLRVQIRNEGPVRELLRRGSPFLLVFWHGSMVYPWWYMRHRNAAGLVSLSRDGEILTRVLQRWGYHLVRGSSNRGGKEAMEAMRRTVCEGHVLCVTPDGPRGPYHELKMGALRVAQTTGVPLVAMSVGYSACRRVGSWDRFEIPLPFARARVEFDDPATIDPGLTGDALEARRAELQRRMDDRHRALAADP